MKMDKIKHLFIISFLKKYFVRLIAYPIITEPIELKWIIANLILMELCGAVPILQTFIYTQQKRWTFGRRIIVADRFWIERELILFLSFGLWRCFLDKTLAKIIYSQMNGTSTKRSSKHLEVHKLLSNPKKNPKN